MYNPNAKYTTFAAYQTCVMFNVMFPVKPYRIMENIQAEGREKLEFQ